MTRAFRYSPKNGEYFLLEDADILPLPRKPLPQPPRLPLKVEKFDLPSKNRFVPPPPATKESKDLTVWERQAFRNAQRQNAPPVSPESKPPKISIWERHAARKAEKEREKALKEKESQLVNSDSQAPALTDAFRAYKQNQEENEKEDPKNAPAAKGSTPGPGSGQVPPSKQKGIDVKSLSFNLNFALFEAVIGSVGGVVVGIESGYFAASRLPTPNVPLPTNSPMTGNFQTGIKHGATAWKFVKRAAISGLMFSFIEQQLEEIRNKSDWKNSAYSGFICGSMFGLRGGPRGVIVGALGFAGFGAIAALSKDLLPPTK